MVRLISLLTLLALGCVASESTAQEPMIITPLQIQGADSLFGQLAINKDAPLKTQDLNALKKLAIEQGQFTTEFIQPSFSTQDVIGSANNVIVTQPELAKIEPTIIGGLTLESRMPNLGIGAGVEVSQLAATRFGAEVFRDMYTTEADARPAIIRPTVTSAVEIFGPSVLEITNVPVIDPTSLSGFQVNAATIAAEVLEPSPHPSPGSNLRILEGEPVLEPDVYMDTVMFYGVSAGKIEVCSGVLISPDTAITAAHCACETGLQKALVGTSFLSTHEEIDIDHARTVSLLDCQIFAADNAYLAGIGNGDIGLIYLKRPSAVTTFRKIASEAMIRRAASVRAIGFGATSGEGAPALRGKFLVDIVIASYDCSDVAALFPDQGYRCQATNEMVAAGAGRDTCGGDSGGGVFVLGVDLQLYLAGITSRSVDPKGACGPGGIYVKLSDADLRAKLVAKGVPSTSFAAN